MRAWPATGRAHGGHDHSVLGTVKSVAAERLGVETKDGKTVSIFLNADTRFRRGTTPAAAADVKVGDRAAVTVREDGDKKPAREVRLPSAKTTEKGPTATK